MTSRQTLKDFLRNFMGTQQDSISYNLKTEDGIIEQGDDLGLEPELDKPLLDLDDQTAGILGDYLSYIIDLSSNEFKLKPVTKHIQRGIMYRLINVRDIENAKHYF